ncbi:MAG: 50S ribosomal protein L30 [Bacteroidetes bacterium]|nr:50S ribosomal protein L30 [Bacteroidota bacterium]
MASIKITQIKSAIKRPEDQKRTLIALGLGRIGKSATHEATPQIKGMVAKVNHMIKIED